MGKCRFGSSFAGVSLLPDRKYAPRTLGSILILGLGKSGKSAVRYCAGLLGGRVESMVVYAGADTQDARDFMAQFPQVEAVFGSEDVRGDYDLCIASPGISQFSAFYQAAQEASCEVISEVEFSWRESAKDSVWVAVTGTNGKTTTTALTAYILKGAGMNAAAVGNIGDVCLDAVAAGQTDVYVAETSSYQLASTRLFAPHASVIMNITPDHLSWHTSFEEYAKAKLKVLDNLAKTTGTAVLVATDEEVRKTVRALKDTAPCDRYYSYIPVGTASGIRESMRVRCGSDNAAYVDQDGVLRIDRGDESIALVSVNELNIKGDHNVENALCAASAAISVGADPASVAESLRSFQPLEHRLEPCGTVNGVACYNDSKATNVDAVLKALGAFADGSTVLLVGGKDKGTDLAPLVELTNVKSHAVVCFGAAGPRFEQAFRDAAGPVEIITAAHMEDALDAGLAAAKPGDALLLSPACASFDEFSCFEERGEVFKKLVADRMAK